MAYIDCSCINCGACESECPMDAISRGNTNYVIDTNKCVECGVCQGICPANAIRSE